MHTSRTQQEFDDYYGLNAPWMTEEDNRIRRRQITRIARYYGDLDEDTIDYEGMKKDEEYN